MNNEIHEVTLEKFAYGGEAMGRLTDGRAVFVPFGMPNEKVRVRLTEEKRGFARAEIVDVLQASPLRIAPRCKHFTACGGCHYQSLSYEDQLRVKVEVLRDQLQRIGKIENPPISSMVPSPDAWNYRNHMQFHVNHEGRVGFVPSSGRGILPITECHLPEKNINDFWPELNFETNEGLDRISLRAGKDDDLMLVIESETPETPEMEVEADVSVVHIFDEHPAVIAGQDHLTLTIRQTDFRVSAGSFFQVNTRVAEKMVEHLLARLKVDSSTVFMDVYCGVGLFSKFFASTCRQLIGIESAVSSCEDFAFNLDEFENVELYEGTAEEILPNLKAQPNIILVDPPRAGIEKHALDAILAFSPQTIAYVSCDPATLARDAARLISGGYRLVDITPFDLFPQTYHIESVSIFERN